MDPFPGGEAVNLSLQNPQTPTESGERLPCRLQLRVKRYADAEKQFLTAIAEKQKDMGADHWRIGGYIDPLIADYKAWGKPDLAAQWQAKCAALKPKLADAS